MHDSRRLSGYIKERVTGDDMWYVFLDEVQMCRGLESVLNGLNRRENLDIYVTGSNSKFLSTDVLTEFRGCGDNCMAALVNILASAVGSLTNPLKLANTFGSNGMHVSDKTIGIYIGYLLDAFFISKSQRYDIKGKRYIASPFKHYFTDMRLRNAQLNFRQQEENHIMENIIYNELLIRGFNVDVGGVDHSERNDNGKAVRNKHNTPITQTTNKPKSSNNPTKTQIIFFTKSPHHFPPRMHRKSLPPSFPVHPSVPKTKIKIFQKY